MTSGLFPGETFTDDAALIARMIREITELRALVKRALSLGESSVALIERSAELIVRATNELARTDAEMDAVVALELERWHRRVEGASE